MNAIVHGVSQMRALGSLVVLAFVVLAEHAPAQVMYYVPPSWVPMAPPAAMIVPTPTVPMTLERYYVLPSSLGAPPASSTEAKNEPLTLSEPAKAPYHPSIIVREYHLSSPNKATMNRAKLQIPPWREEFARPPLTEEPMILIPVIPTDVPKVVPRDEEPSRVPDKSVPV